METVVDLSVDDAIGLGVKLYAEDRKKEAENLFRGALRGNPASFKAMFWIGICCFDRRDLYESLYRFDRATKIERRNPVALSNKGMVFSELGHYAEAETELRRALAIDPKSHIAQVNLANVLVRDNRLVEGLSAADRALALNPNDDIGHFNRGIALYSLDRVEESIVAYDAALRVNPQNAEAAYNRSNALLKVGRLKEGFAAYDSRLSTDQAGNYYYFEPTAPWWKGEDLAGKTLLIHGEQGIGDSIMFMRYVDELRDRYRGAKFILVPHTALLSMCQADFGPTFVVSIHPAADKNYPAHDFYTYLMSIPGILGTDLDSIPKPWDPCEQFIGCETCAKWGQKVDKDGFNVGICWSGNWIHKNDAHRSMTLKEFAPIIADHPDINFHCLQKEIRDCDRDLVKFLDISTYCADLTDMRETAHLANRMDLVISVDTAVAHLAATMAIPIWILLPKFRTDWRWMMTGKQTPWYPSASLFRQSKIGDWTSAISQVSLVLADCRKRHAA
jgi:tetratricopeptide (TPR) repeat protein